MSQYVQKSRSYSKTSQKNPPEYHQVLNQQEERLNKKRQKRKQEKKKKKTRKQNEAKLALAQVIDQIFSQNDTYVKHMQTIKMCLGYLKDGCKFHKFLNQVIGIQVNNIQSKIWQYSQNLLKSQVGQPSLSFFQNASLFIFKQYMQIRKGCQQLLHIICDFLDIVNPYQMALYQQSYRNIDRKMFAYLVNSDDTLEQLVLMCCQKVQKPQIQRKLQVLIKILEQEKNEQQQENSTEQDKDQTQKLNKQIDQNKFQEKQQIQGKNITEEGQDQQISTKLTNKTQNVTDQNSFFSFMNEIDKKNDLCQIVKSSNLNMLNYLMTIANVDVDVDKTPIAKSQNQKQQNQIAKKQSINSDSHNYKADTQRIGQLEKMKKNFSSQNSIQNESFFKNFKEIKQESQISNNKQQNQSISNTLIRQRINIMIKLRQTQKQREILREKIRKIQRQAKIAKGKQKGENQKFLKKQIQSLFPLYQNSKKNLLKNQQDEGDWQSYSDNSCSEDQNQQNEKAQASLKKSGLNFKFSEKDFSNFPSNSHDSINNNYRQYYEDNLKKLNEEYNLNLSKTQKRHKKNLDQFKFQVKEQQKIKNTNKMTQNDYFKQDFPLKFNQFVAKTQTICLKDFIQQLEIQDDQKKEKGEKYSKMLQKFNHFKSKLDQNANKISEDLYKQKESKFSLKKSNLFQLKNQQISSQQDQENPISFGDKKRLSIQESNKIKYQKQYVIPSSSTLKNPFTYDSPKKINLERRKQYDQNFMSNIANFQNLIRNKKSFSKQEKLHGLKLTQYEQNVFKNLEQFSIKNQQQRLNCRVEEGWTQKIKQKTQKIRRCQGLLSNYKIKKLDQIKAQNMKSDKTSQKQGKNSKNEKNPKKQNKKSQK